MTSDRHAPAPAEPPTLSVVIMAFNEAVGLPTVAEEIRAELIQIGCTHEILVVDDGSSDGTGAVADGLARTIPNLRVVRHATNLGLGGVYRTGFAEARGTWLTFFPADGQFPASIIGRYLAASEGVDMILGTLSDRRDSLVGQALSFAERSLLRALFGHFPSFQGILMFRRELLACTTLVSEGRGWTVLMELILRADRAGARIANIPITIRPRNAGASKVNNLRSVVSNLRQVIELRRKL